MLKFTLRRIATGLILLFVVCSLSFYLLSLGSANVARAILGVNATQADIIKFNILHGLDKPFITQYWNWLSHAVRFDFGDPWGSPYPVFATVKAHVTVTLVLVGIATIFSGLVSVLLGVAAALKKGWVDRIVQLLGLIGFAVPNFLIALGIILLFAVKFHIFQAVGYTPATQGFVLFLKTATLPIFALFFTSLASVTQQVRGSVKDAIENDYVRTLRTRGLSFNRVIYKHVLRNAIGPALTVLGLQFIGMLGGAVIIENIFAIPGIGPLTVQSVSQHDVPTVMGIVTMTAILVVGVNLILDLISAALNPKVRLS